MSNNTLSELEPLQLIIPIGSAAHDAAYQLSQLQPDDDKALQIYGNVLAVYGVHAYLELVGFESDVLASDSFNPVLAMFGDVADLVLPELGRLECRLIDGQAQVVTIPHIHGEWLGCVVLRMAGAWEDIEDLTALEVVGFTPHLAAEIAVSDLGATTELLQLLGQLRSEVVVMPGAARSIFEQVRELFPRLNLSIITMARRFDEFVKTENHPNAFFYDWLLNFLLGNDLRELQFKSAVERNAIDEEEITEEMKLELQRLSMKLARVWKSTK